MSKNKNIIIVGGGTAGLVSALIIKERTSCNVQLIKSDKIGIIGVGEGSTEHWEDFMTAARLDVVEMFKETDATIKLGIYFKDWTREPYYHNINHFNENKIGQQAIGLSLNYINNVKQVKCADYHNIDNKIQNLKNESPSRQFHFNTFKLNGWLLRKCVERNIQIVDDEILDVEISEKGIDTLKGKKQDYNSDFYIDCTGFKRLLISKLGAKWQSYSKYLKLNEAIAFPTGDTDEYTPFTTATAMSSGWMWRIPVFGRHGNGYIYDNNFINAEQAKLEAERHLGYEVEIAKNIKFEPGALDKPWIKNCMATGLAANFVEPLEASSIATSINQTFIFLNHIAHNEVEKFNSKMNSVMNNIRDFVALHYLVDKNDSDFWLNIKNVELPDTLSEKLQLWKHRFAVIDDFKSPDYLLFKEDNFNHVLYGINYCDKDSVKKSIDIHQENYLSYCKSKNSMYYEDLEGRNYISHKKYLQEVRNWA